MARSRSALAPLAALLLVAAGCAAPRQAAPTQTVPGTAAASATPSFEGKTLNIVTGGTGGVYIVYGAGLADMLTKKMKVAALRGALSDRARGDRVHVLSALAEGEAPSTKQSVTALATVAASKHVLVVAPRTDELTWKSLRNAPTVHLLDPGQLNTYDVLVSDDVVFTKAALESFLNGPADDSADDNSADKEESK